MVSVVIQPYEPLVYKAIEAIERLEPNYFQGIDKIVLEHGDPGHFGKVQSDQPGTIFVSMQKLKGAMHGAEEQEIIINVAGVLAHEMGHLKANFEGGENPAMAEENRIKNLLRNQMMDRAASAARYARRMHKIAAIKPVATPQELSDSVLRIIYHFAQKVNPSHQREYLQQVSERMRAVDATEVASRQRNPGGGIGATISLTKNILAGQPPDTVAAALNLIQQRITQL